MLNPHTELAALVQKHLEADSAVPANEVRAALAEAIRLTHGVIVGAEVIPKWDIPGEPSQQTLRLALMDLDRNG